MKERSPTLSMRLKGELACFTRPEFKTERVSYEVMTPSAARGALEAVLWKPAIRWQVERVLVLKPILFTAFKRNEVSKKVPADAIRAAMSGGWMRDFFADEERAQRNTVALVDVDYVVDATFCLTAKAGPGETITKFVEMFTRRVAKGQAFNQPYLGCREFAAEFLPADGAPSPIAVTRDLGIMLHDISFGTTNRARFFDARLGNGVLEIPPWNPTEDAA